MKRPRHTKRRKAAARSASSSSASEAMHKASPAAKKLGAYAQALGSYAARLRPCVDKARLHANKLRPYVDKARFYIGKLRPYVDKLRPFMDRLRPYVDQLRRYAVKAVDAVGSWLHRGIVQVAKVSPRTARRLEAVEAWVCQSDGHKLSGAALVAVLVLGIGFAAIFPEAAGRYGRVIFTSNRVVPLPAETRRTVREKAKELAAALDGRLDRKRKLAGETWTSARILVALRENDPDYASRIDVKRVEQYFRSMAGPECACWRRFPQGKHPNHVGVTSWVLWTFAQYGIPAHKSELEFLLSAQSADGGWPLFGGAQEEKFTSSYGTAAAILALHAQAPLQPDRGQRKRVAAAVDRGVEWLKSRVVSGRARWADYPAGPRRPGRGGRAGLPGGPGARESLPGGLGFCAFRAASRGRGGARLARPRLAARAPRAGSRRAARRSLREGGAGGQPPLHRRDALLRAPLDDTRDGGGLPQRRDFPKDSRSAVALAGPPPPG